MIYKEFGILKITKMSARKFLKCKNTHKIISYCDRAYALFSSTKW